MIEVDQLSMTYRVPVRASGLGAAFRSLFKRQFRSVEALQALSFQVGAGEIVGFLGPNGAGKTTTLKILSGILHPTAGSAKVMGAVPWQREHSFLRQIAMVRGSRPISVPSELTVLDALNFQKLVYEVPDDAFKRNLAELVELLDLESLLARQVRALSLGERMRAGLAWSLIYRPRVLFLDEPTIGLDVEAVGRMRRFITDYRQKTAATILLTSHYMADLEALTQRLIVINKGKLAYDGPLTDLGQRLVPYKLIRISFANDPQIDWSRFGEVIEADSARVCLRIERQQVSHVTARLLESAEIKDLSVADPSLEEVIGLVYQGA